jgi:hypothetical protein
LRRTRPDGRKRRRRGGPRQLDRWRACDIGDHTNPGCVSIRPQGAWIDLGGGGALIEPIKRGQDAGTEEGKKAKANEMPG